MNKADMINHIADQTSLTKADSEKALNAILLGITDALKSKQDVTLIGFGSFSTVKKAAREGRNPRTGESIQIPASTQARFRAGKTLKEAVNV
jgi:DNA-binding protein HU-beta